MNYDLKIDQLLQTGVQKFQVLSSKMSQSTVGQLAGRAIIQIRKNILNEYIQNNLELASRVILIANLGAAIFSGVITRHLESKDRKSTQSPEVKANKGIKIFTATALVLNTGFYLLTSFPANSAWLIGLALAQTIAATVYFKNKELKEYQENQDLFQAQILSLTCKDIPKNELIQETKDKLVMSERALQDLKIESAKKEKEEKEKLDFFVIQNKGLVESKSKLEESHKIALEAKDKQIKELSTKISNQKTELESKDQHYQPQINHTVKENQRLITENEQLQKQIEDLNSKLTEAKQEIGNLRMRPDFEKKEIEKLKNQVTELNSKLSKSNRKSNT